MKTKKQQYLELLQNRCNDKKYGYWPDFQIVSLSQYKQMKTWTKRKIWDFIKGKWPNCYTVRFCQTYYTKRDLLESLSIEEIITL